MGSLDTGMHNRAITVLHGEWMCLGMQRHTHITRCNLVANNLIPISVPFYNTGLCRLCTFLHVYSLLGTV